MDCCLHVILLFSLCFIAVFPHLSHSSRQSSLWNGNKEIVFIYRNFLTNEECDHFISLAKDSLEKSMVTDLETGESIESEYRTSTGAFLNKAQDEVVANVEARIAAWTFLPEDVDKGGETVFPRSEVIPILYDFPVFRVNYLRRKLSFLLNLQAADSKPKA
uniref:Type 2 proly 4-hydroxylase n=1 Tax=Solanum tuberosum TaxID=4113 RepID=M1DS64_SOLTU